MMRALRLLSLMAAVLGSAGLWPARALALELPAGAELRAQEALPMGQVSLPQAGFDGTTTPSLQVEGQVNWQAWRLSGGAQTSFQILSSLRDQLIADGYEPLFQCQAVSCGGYDFRFAAGHFNAPDIFVDLSDYHYLSARKGAAFVGILTSRMTNHAYVELVQITPPGDEASAVSARGGVARQPTSAPVVTGPLAQRLEAQGRVVLKGLSFATGSATLDEGDVPSLAELARYLTQNPSRKIVLVGHTDAEGSLEGNINLSRKRAASVMERLVALYGVPGAQISAQGVGFLLPLASNLSAEGREANRRVEAVLISTE